MPKLDQEQKQNLKRIRNVIVFGDSLSDIGKKWKTNSGQVAQKLKKMYVSPTGRFSDCRNWTDFMYEEATKGRSLIQSTVEESIKFSQQHTTLDSASVESAGHHQWFVYANYAEGGACGDTPWSNSKKPFLGTFKNQIQAFKKDAAAVRKRWTGHFNLEDATLFIIWFGANDLFTAKRPFGEMGLVAYKVAVDMRNDLNAFMRNSNFVFVNLPDPLASVRYQTRRDQADSNTEKGKTMLANIEDLKKGVTIFNEMLRKHVEANSQSRVVNLNTFITETNLRNLVLKDMGLQDGAENQPSTVHYAPSEYRSQYDNSKLAVVDGAHPTDRAYELIWKLIRREIKTAGLTFGHLFEESLSKDADTDMYRTLKGIKKAQPAPFDRGLM